jgi:hypothetical protein
MMRPGAEICTVGRFEAVPNRDTAGLITNGIAFCPPSEIFSGLVRTDLFVPEVRNMLMIQEKDPLTPIELADLDESLEDLRCGRVDYAPESLSEEEFLAWLKSE